MDKNSIVEILKMAQTSIRWSFNWAEWNPTEKEFLRAVSCIQLEEKKRIGRFIFRKDARASLVGRLLMRKFVNEYANIPYDQIQLTRDQYNKPVLQNAATNVNFNVSHQGCYAVLAGEMRDVNVGVDVMKLEYTGGKRLSEFFRIMNRNFSPLEWNEIKGSKSTSESEQIIMFCRHWALKESYVKALGVGITVDLRKIDFKTNSKLLLNELITDTDLYMDGVKQNWLFEESLLDSDHCVAVALEKNNITSESGCIAFQRINFEKLMENAVSLFPEDLDYCNKYFMKNERP